jgi:hypothetical protein
MLDEDEQDAQPTYRHRGWHTDPRRAAAHKWLIDLHLERAAECEIASRPENGPAEKKDDLAIDAIEAAAGLLDAIAGWAVSHTTGLGLAGLEPTRYVPHALRQEPDYIARQADLDRHDHEARGTGIAFEKATPAEQRRAARNLLGILSRSHTMGVVLRPISDALAALEFGETLPILAPAGSGQKREYREMMAQLLTVGLVAYRQAIGGNKQRARAEVAAAFGVAEDTIRTWEGRLKRHPMIGRFEVERTIWRAKNAASGTVESKRGGTVDPRLLAEFDAEFGTAALQRAGADYQAILREKP